MISISPGLGGVKDKGLANCSPDERFKALFEVALFGIGGVIVTKSWLPLIAPFAYAFLEQAWYNSRVPTKIDESTNGSY